MADVLLLFVEGAPSLGVTEIARRLGLSKTVVHRILRSLASRDFVFFDDRTRYYTLGPAAAALGARALRHLELREVADPVLRKLQHETGETATVSCLVGTSRTYLDQVPSLKEIKMTVEIGRPFPLHAGASSKAILAFCHPALRRQVLSGPLKALTSLTKTRADELEEDLEEVARTGVAISRGERQPGAGSVATCVLGVDGYAIGSISVCGPADRFDEGSVRRITPLVREAGEEISRQMGWEDSPRGELSPRNGG